MLELTEKTNSLGLSQEAFEKLEAMIDEGLASIEAGRTIPADEVRLRMRKVILEVSQSKNYELQD